MIESVRIVNFKSLGDMRLRLERFNCLIGMNGAGKSTVLQALDFLSQLMLGDVQGWLDRRGWDKADLNSKFRKERNITFNVGFRTSTGARLNWIGVFNRTDLRCSNEYGMLFTASSGVEDQFFHSDGRTFKLNGQDRQDIPFNFQGSLLSALKDKELPPSLLEFREALRRIRSLELLSPHLLRKSARVSDHDIGAGGEKLSAYLDNIKGERKSALIALLQRFYPALVDFKVKSQRSGWKKLSVIEQFGGHHLETEASHLNDGLLRILAVLTQADSDRSLILLDEIENGINQEIVQALVDTLVDSPQQILVTTHSPLVLNYLTDEVARKSVQLLYKNQAGETRVRHFFDIPRMADKLRAMGPGDAFVDTDLNVLAQECIAEELAVERQYEQEAAVEARAEASDEDAAPEAQKP